MLKYPMLETILPIIIVVAIVVGVLGYALVLHKKVNKSKYSIKQTELNERRKSVKVNKVTGFIPPKLGRFYDALKLAMPANYAIIPNVALELLFQRFNRRDLRLEGKYADFCIFTDRFVPVLVVDLRDFSTAADESFVIPDGIKDILRTVGIPVLDYAVADSYSIDDLRRSIAKVMNPLYTK